MISLLIVKPFWYVLVCSGWIYSAAQKAHWKTHFVDLTVWSYINLRRVWPEVFDWGPARCLQRIKTYKNYHLKIHLVKQKGSRDSQKSWTLAPGLKSSDLIESNTCNPVSTCSLLFKHPLKTEGSETKLGFVTLCVTATPMDDQDVPSETVLGWMSRMSPQQDEWLCPSSIFL